MGRHDRLNAHFASVCPAVAESLSRATNVGETLEPRPPRVCASALRVTPATLPELSAALGQMGVSRASGVDGVTHVQLRVSAAVFRYFALFDLLCFWVNYMTDVEYSVRN